MFIVGVAISMAICKTFATSRKRSLSLYLWHTLLCLIYAYYVTNNGGDAIRYYQNSLTLDVDFSLGTAAVEYITALFSSGFW